MPISRISRYLSHSLPIPTSFSPRMILFIALSIAPIPSIIPSIRVLLPTPQPHRHFLLLFLLHRPLLLLPRLLQIDSLCSAPSANERLVALLVRAHFDSRAAVVHPSAAFLPHRALDHLLIAQLPAPAHTPAIPAVPSTPAGIRALLLAHKIAEQSAQMPRDVLRQRLSA